MAFSTKAAVVLSACIGGLLSASPSARAEDVVLQNVVVARGGWTATAPRLEVSGSNLSRDQLTSLFSAEKPDAALLRSLKADRIVAPEITATRDGGTVTIRNTKASGVSGGRVKAASFESMEGSARSSAGVSPGRVVFRSGAASVADADLNRLIDVAAGADFGSGSLPAAALSWSEGVATFYSPGPAGGPETESFELSFGSFTTQNGFDGDTPTKGSGEVKRISFAAPAESAVGKSLKTFGFDAINAELSFAGAYDKAAKRLELTDYRFTTQGAGALSINGRLESVDPTLFTGSPDAKRAAMMKSAVSTVTMRFQDQGLVAKTSDYFARETHKTAAAVRAEWSSVAASLIPLMLNGAPASNAIATAVSQFIAKPTSLTLTAKSKDGATPISALRDMAGPKILSAIDLVATTEP